MTDEEKAEQQRKFWEDLASWRNQTPPSQSGIAGLSPKWLPPGAYQQDRSKEGRDEPDRYILNDDGTYSPWGGGYSTDYSPSQGAKEYGKPNPDGSYGWGSINPSGTDKGWTEEQVRQEQAYRARKTLPEWVPTVLGGLGSFLTGPFTALNAAKAGVGALVGPKVREAVSGLFGSKDTDEELQKRLEYFTLQPVRQQEAALTGPLSDDYRRSGSYKTDQQRLLGEQTITPSGTLNVAPVNQTQTGTLNPQTLGLYRGLSGPWHPDVSDLYDVGNPMGQKPPSTAALPRNVAENLLQSGVQTTVPAAAAAPPPKLQPPIAVEGAGGRQQPPLTAAAGWTPQLEALSEYLKGIRHLDVRPPPSRPQGPTTPNPAYTERRDWARAEQALDQYGPGGSDPGLAGLSVAGNEESPSADPNQYDEGPWTGWKGGGMVNPRPMMGGIGGRGEVLRRMFGRAT